MGKHYLRKVKTEDINYNYDNDFDVIRFIRYYANDNGYFWVDDIDILFDNYEADVGDILLKKVDKFLKENDLYGEDLRVDYEWNH